ncbi:hypothetical protein, variant 3 [Blastomyces dermatitidis ER-3]|uniref:Uncharacterized protein n=1 Tax=Ajellomyces dermatitidis (strain ER-3 / ATCC MYA-2586) TaxID=559297 RepID=A0ABX2VUR2_AJEDR|nr:uncharacterized protein BDCG_03845 [Blastomyces dermatitidis ER-3]XP_045280636.1 hypothetical protein, variant 1 [Blastomyces dermatitidis ER-3]XP_045280637.1 hypothetical protein, variant 2 [Blastomyces dermatitidis ER-3]XP_045280638.1 hypothetical protein, variant 3 [Blastomyces dermatitidis ER-3]EEQ88725.1 hypothetical protein BDCG_03845 [Blastomyces dermatitidis ER-3]OAT00909.1 hypothetical protein, variant 1 [Blastomyces dermatitidis ER-3]OAT00910.1 hypothetical protein, variant 2 [Bl
MSSSVLHHCTYCGHDSEISNSLAAFAENPYCRQCGLSAAEGDSKMQDDLAILFARQMSVAGISNPNQNTASPPQSMVPAVIPPTPDMSPSPPSTPSTSIPRPNSPTAYLKHYHHSRPPAPRHGSMVNDAFPPPLHAMQQAGILSRRNAIPTQRGPTALFPSQLTLFTQADVDQKSRLIELWQISRPSAGKGSQMSTSSLPSNMHFSSQDAMATDVDSMDRDTRSATGVDHNQHEHAEPYVMSGYEALAQREYNASAARDACEQAFAMASQFSVAGAAAGAAAAGTPALSSYKPAVDPVYKGHDWWGHHDQQGQQQGHGQGVSEAESLLQPMENQYGAFEQRSNTMYMGCGIRRAHWLDEQEML